jgi:hypothetical protein
MTDDLDKRQNDATQRDEQRGQRQQSGQQQRNTDDIPKTSIPRRNRRGAGPQKTGLGWTAASIISS